MGQMPSREQILGGLETERLNLLRQLQVEMYGPEADTSLLHSQLSLFNLSPVLASVHPASAISPPHPTRVLVPNTPPVPDPVPIPLPFPAPEPAPENPRRKRRSASKANEGESIFGSATPPEKRHTYATDAALERAARRTAATRNLPGEVSSALDILTSPRYGLEYRASAPDNTFWLVPQIGDSAACRLASSLPQAIYEGVVRIWRALQRTTLSREDIEGSQLFISVDSAPLPRHIAEYYNPDQFSIDYWKGHVPSREVKARLEGLLNRLKTEKVNSGRASQVIAEAVADVGTAFSIGHLESPQVLWAMMGDVVNPSHRGGYSVPFFAHVSLSETIPKVEILNASIASDRQSYVGVSAKNTEGMFTFSPGSCLQHMISRGISPSASVPYHEPYVPPARKAKKKSPQF